MRNSKSESADDDLLDGVGKLAVERLQLRPRLHHLLKVTSLPSAVVVVPFIAETHGRREGERQSENENEIES